MFFCLWYGSSAMKLRPCERDVGAGVPSDAVRCKHKVSYSSKSTRRWNEWLHDWNTKQAAPVKPPCACRAARTYTHHAFDFRRVASQYQCTWSHRSLMHWDSWLRHCIVQPIGGTADPFCEPQMFTTRGPQIKCVSYCLYYTRSIGRPWLNEDCQPTKWRGWHCSCCQAAALIAHCVILLLQCVLLLCSISLPLPYCCRMAPALHYKKTGDRGQMSFWIGTDTLFQHNIMFIFIYLFIN
jgi:hypothetical protein